MIGRLVSWAQYVAERPAMAECPSNGLLGVMLDWDAGGEIARVTGILPGGREVLLADLVAEDPRPILSTIEVDSMVWAAIETLAETA